jgi:hypothetical protein
MALEFYVPYGYESEIETFKANAQNYSIDFKIKTAPTTAVLAQNSSYILWDVPLAALESSDNSSIVVGGQSVFRKQIPFINSTTPATHVGRNSSYYQRLFSDLVLRTTTASTYQIAWRSGIYFNVSFESCNVDSGGIATITFTINSYSDLLKAQVSQWISDNTTTPTLDDFYNSPCLFLFPETVSSSATNGLLNNGSATLNKTRPYNNSYTTTYVKFDGAYIPVTAVGYTSTELTFIFDTGNPSLSGNQDIKLDEAIRTITALTPKPTASGLIGYDLNMLTYYGKGAIDIQNNIIQTLYNIPKLVKKSDTTFNPYTTNIKNLDNYTNTTAYALTDCTMYNYIEATLAVDDFMIFNISIGRPKTFSGSSQVFYSTQLLSNPGAVIQESGVELRWAEI